ncbi:MULTISPECIES: APC family permease [unclassified Streptomyces]|uniref:APC family permease n=1 Tax=unclassified Streptomyces TaxID=2593676 RepID=UPI00036A0182|nr:MULTISPECIES: APC family permease [unclassified Streptomyces]MYT34052.1 amino acid permease [Streptomyces sp. SID8354]
MEMHKPPAPAAPRNPGLKRDIGLIGLIWTSEGSIIGSGWLFGSLFAAQAAGTAALVSWGIGAVAIIILAFVHAELGAMYPVAGGTARFPHYAFGSAAGASFGWFSWLQAVTVAPIEVMASLNYLSVHTPWVQTGKNHLTPAGYGLAVAFMAFFVVVNFFGIRWLAHTNSVATWWKLAVPVLTIIVMATAAFHPGNFGYQGFSPFGAKGMLSAVSTSGIIFALLGFEQADQLAGESSNPARDIPRAVIGSILIGVLVYVLLQAVFIGALPHSAFAHGGWADLSFSGKAGPFAGLATSIGLGWLATLLYIDAVISPSGTGLVYVTATSRVSYGLSRNGYVPAVFERTTTRGVPWLGLLVAFVVGLIVFLPFPTWQKLVGFVTSASVLMYAGAPLAFGCLRRQDPDRPRPYRLPGGLFWAPLAFIVANLIIYWAGWDTLWRLGVAIVLGYLVLGGSALLKLNPKTPHPDWRSAQWLPVYLLGMGVISWQGGFCSTGPASKVSCGATDAVPLWWDIALIAAFSLAIYFWAQAVRLPDAETQEYIGSVEVVPGG